MKYLIIIFCWTLPFYCMAQYELKGVTIDSISGEPVMFATVFINGSKMGAVTDEKGKFTLFNIHQSDIELVISHVSYKPQIISLSLDSDQLKEIKIILTPQTTVLNEFSFSERKDERWWANYRLFKSLFLGYSKNGMVCKIKNPEILFIHQDDFEGFLEVSSNEFLIIDNPSLGYTIKLLLIDFGYYPRNGYVSYIGYPYFEEYPKVTKKHLKNRLKAYMGSPQHFFSALISDSLLLNGFKLQHLYRYQNPDRPSDEDLKKTGIAFWKETNSVRKDSLSKILEKGRLPRIIARLDTTQILASQMFYDQEESGDIRHISFEGFRQIIYLKEKEEIAYIHKFTKYPYRKPVVQTSVISMLVDKAPINQQGHLLNPLDLMFEGYWSFEKIGELLPMEYQPNETN